MSNNVCPDCGKLFPPNAPNGLCPACLLGLAQPGPGTAHSTPPPASDFPTEDDAGSSARRIGRYRLLEIIGEGGFGTVWMAEQLEPVRRRVALKVIKLGMDTRQVVARFEAERQALALMDHPSIARVFDAGATEAGRPFFVMELVRGVPITEFCDARRFNTRDRLDLFVPVCQAVQHAHQKGVIHRDLKPSNILVTEQDGRAVPKIIDFGVAKAIEDPLTDKTLFTRFHQFLGTPAYMSPEQAGLGGLDIDTRSDIYSLGVLLYEMLTGQPPLDPRQLREAGYEAILKTIREVEPPKPSTQLRRRLSASPLNDSARARLTGREAQIEEDLDWIVLKALEKDRARRYETANGLAADLRRYLENEPIAARPPSALYRIGKLARRHKLVFAAAGAVSAAVVVGLVATAWQGQRAERHFEQARRNAYASEMNTAFHAWEAGRVLRARELLERQRPASGSSLKDLRGFDWRYLWSRTRPAELFTLTNATDWGFALSGDGKTLVGLVASSGDTNVDWHLQFWNLPERRLLAKLKSDTAWIFNGAFSPDDSKFVVPQVSSTDTNYFLQLWRAESRQLIARLPMGIPLGAAFSPDGKLLAASSGHMYVADQPGALWLWDAATGRLLRPPLELPLWAYQVAFSPDSASLAVSCGDGVARVLDVASSNTQAELRGHNGFVAAVAFTHDGTRLVTGDERGYVRIWDWANGYPEKTFKAHDRPIYQISITADNQRFVTASRDFTARLWDRNTGQELSRFAGHNGGVTSARLLPGDETLVTASQDHNVKVWNARPRREGGLVIPNPKQTDALLTSGGRYVAVVDWRGSSIAFHDATTGAVVTNLPGLAVAALRDGSQLAVLSQKDVVFYDPIELAEVGRTALPSQLGGRPCVSPDDRWLAFRRAETGAGERRTRVVVVDVTRRSVVRELETDIDGVDGWAPVYFARGGRLLLTARMQAQQFAVWDTATWRRVKVLSGFPASEYVVATVSPDGGTLAVSGFGGRLHLWDLERLQPLPSIDPGAGDIYSLAFEPRGEILALGAIDGTIRLWNLQARQELGALHGHSSLVRYLNFSPDGRTLLSGSHDASIRLWRAPSWEEIKNAEARVPGPSRAQRRP